MSCYLVKKQLINIKIFMIENGNVLELTFF
jgi:hypothetical protein